MESTRSEYIEVRDSKIHNNGVFAVKDIPKGTKIIEYVGNKITKSQSDKRSDEILEENKKNSSYGAVYIFELNKKYDLDGSVEWNTAKYINHSCSPNCEVNIIKGHIWIISSKDIKKGEELFYNYGYEYDDDYESHPCKCDSKNCIGFILAEEHWNKVKKSK
ncbi:SET domain-containing protein-lysine N-methyltransferase [Candidatus Woesearchaeota archaeon]|nr:SET domain-containing protein-lysine N-methyltransferase [Candidatus Woesearchaeota archaeon]